MSKPRLIWVCVSLIALAFPAFADEKSCKQELGKKKSDILVEQCLAISPATHPPCNALNPCDLIIDEINRGCKMAKDDLAADPKAPPLPDFCKNAK